MPLLYNASMIHREFVSKSLWLFLIPSFKLCSWSVLLLLLLLQDGLTALHRAIICKKQAVTNYLLRESANPFVRDKVSTTQQLSFETVVFEKTVAEHYVFSCFPIYLKILTYELALSEVIYYSWEFVHFGLEVGHALVIVNNLILLLLSLSFQFIVLFFGQIVVVPLVQCQG